MNRRASGLCVLIIITLSGPAGCGGSGDTLGLDDFLPAVPEPTGQPQSVAAGAITPDNADELIAGPAASGLVGDFFMRNRHARYVIQAPTRVMGVVPQGGNLIDAVPIGPDGAALADDHFGELSFMYLVGRTCEHREIEIVLDGSGGGAAVLRARGIAATNDFLNFRSIGLINVPAALDPDIEDGVECATTYILEPDADSLHILFTLFNPGDTPIRGPLGVLSDTGGDTQAWSPTRGFERLGIGDLAALGEPTPVEYTLYQGPGVAYGALPRHDDAATRNATFVISGISILLFGADALLDILDEQAHVLDLPARDGRTFAVDFAVGRDAADIDASFRAGRGEPTADVSGTAAWLAGGVPDGARIGIYEDSDGDGVIGADDVIRAYMDVENDGAFSGALVPGNYLARAEVPDLARSDAVAFTLTDAGVTGVNLTLPDPGYYDYTIIDGDTGMPIPARITIIGRHPVFPDERVFSTDDRTRGMIRTIHSMRGTTIDIGDGAEPLLALPAGGTYRVFASRGTEWSTDSIEITVEPGAPVGAIDLVLHHVAPADGYLSSEYHVHQLGSMDSTITHERRVASTVAEGVELFAATDHDFVTDLQPTIEALGVSRLVRNIVGTEVTTFGYGHFNAWPITPDPTTPNFGAIDWARGMEGYAMIPGEIFDAVRNRGAELIQVNHPRSTVGGTSAFLQYFDRAGLAYDYGTRQIVGDFLNAPIPNEWLRLPEVSLWDDSFNALEVWNQFNIEDTNGDGVREIAGLDIVMRDWFNFLSLGFVVTPVASSDTHEVFSKPAGMPRTYVRVSDDSPDALETGAAVPDALATLSGAARRDVVLTNGPHIRVARAGDSASAIGAVLDATTGTVTLSVSIVAADWSAFDTLEVFANATPDVTGAHAALQPLACYTSRDIAQLADNDVCLTAALPPARLDVQLVPVAGAAQRYEATIDVTVTASDIVNRAGATGSDAWLVLRVRGDRAIVPLMWSDGVVSGSTIDTLVSGTDAERDALLDGVGVPATALTAPIFVDFDGGGYTAVFSP